MQRVQLIEIHEQPWFPSWLRDQVTEAMQQGMHALKIYSTVAPMLHRTLATTGGQDILDICSGGGGPWPHLAETLGADLRDLQVRLTDRNPNLEAFESLRAASRNRIVFCCEPVDAREVPREWSGMRTIFSSFHHFPPADAAAVLQDAVDAGSPIAIFEVTGRTPGAILSMIPWALFALIYTPLIRPFRLSRLLWTYIIPVIPMVLFFDGVVSCLRTYQPGELREIVARLRERTSPYDWRLGESASAGERLPITYLIGCPRGETN